MTLIPVKNKYMTIYKNLLRTLISFVRRLLGIEHIKQHLKQQQKLHQLTLLTLRNAIKYSQMDPKTVADTTEYKRSAEIVSLLSPMDVAGGKYTRVGRDYDGGYVMLDGNQINKVDAAYSFGISDDVSWDEAIAKRGIDVYMYDHTISKLPKKHPKFHFYNTGVTGRNKEKSLKTLRRLILENGHSECKSLLLKMDIEGCEWDVLEETSTDVISQFTQIVIEFHGLTQAVFSEKHLSIVNALQKINQTHQSIHVHANGTSTPLWISDLVLPDVLEVTYIRRNDVKEKLTMNTRQFPTELDRPTFEYLPEISLGRFSHNRKFLKP